MPASKETARDSQDTHYAGLESQQKARTPTMSALKCGCPELFLKCGCPELFFRAFLSIFPPCRP